MTDTSSSSRILAAPIWSGVLKFGAPIAIGMGLQTTFNLVDAYVISRLSPETAGPALGALGICDQLTAIGTIVSYGLTTAATALIAQAHGRRDEEAVRKLVFQSMIAVLALSVAFGGVALAFAGPILSGVVGAKGRVAELGASYLRINAGGAFSIYFLLQLTAIQRALGSSKTPVALLLLSNVLNLLLAVLLVYGPGEAPTVFAWGPPISRALGIPRMELTGAAWATIIARTVTLMPVIWILARRFRVFDGALKRHIDTRALAQLWSVAWPSSTQFVVRMSAMLVTHSLVARAFTSPTDQTATTALGIVFRLETLALFIAMGWGSAAQTFVGQNLGAKLLPRARQSGYVAAVYNAFMMVSIAVGYHYFAEPIIAFFDATPSVVAVAKSYVSIVSWSYLGLGTGVVLGSAINASGSTRTTMVADLIVVLTIQLPLCAVAAFATPPVMSRLWFAVAVAYALSGIVYVGVYRFFGWMRPLPTSSLLREPV